MFKPLLLITLQLFFTTNIFSTEDLVEYASQDSFNGNDAESSYVEGYNPPQRTTILDNQANQGAYAQSSNQDVQAKLENLEKKLDENTNLTKLLLLKFQQERQEKEALLKATMGVNSVAEALEATTNVNELVDSQSTTRPTSRGSAQTPQTPSPSTPRPNFVPIPR